MFCNCDVKTIHAHSTLRNKSPANTRCPPAAAQVCNCDSFSMTLYTYKHRKQISHIQKDYVINMDYLRSSTNFVHTLCIFKQKFVCTLCTFKHFHIFILYLGEGSKKEEEVNKSKTVGKLAKLGAHFLFGLVFTKCNIYIVFPLILLSGHHLINTHTASIKISE